MQDVADQVLRLGCAFGRHNYGPWHVAELDNRLLARDCVRCGTKEFQDENKNRIESRWAAGIENV